jgi:hypothetical protein
MFMFFANFKFRNIDDIKTSFKELFKQRSNNCTLCKENLEIRGL